MLKRDLCLQLVMLLLVLMLNPKASFSQKEVSLCEVNITAVKPERFMVGQKIKVVDSMQIAQNQFATLANFLQYQAPIAFRSYGAGQLASISFRGTSANHTAVLWNGLNINFPALGLSDFSTLPMSGFDELSIQYGSAASCVGSDAVGGSILLKSVPKFTQKGLQVLTGINAESSRNYSFQSGIRYYQNLGKNWKLSGKTLFYGGISNNDFGEKPIKNKSGLEYRVEPSKTIQQGFVQDLFALHTNGNMLSLNVWVSDNDLEILPQNLLSREITQSLAKRFSLSYNLGKTLFKTAYINDYMSYGRGENRNPSITNINRWIARIEHDFSWIKSCEKGTNLKIGSEFTQFIANVDGYGDVAKFEKRADFYALFRHQFNQKLTSSINLRQAVVEGFNPPFTPSIGFDYRIINGKTDRINVIVNLARSYRVPTLNERYWVNLGNPELEPEKSFNKELGIVWKRRTSEKWHQQYGISAFHNLIDNWTYWNPDKNYRVENIQQVLAKGLELDFNQQLFLSKATVSLQAQYAINNSSQQKAFGAYSLDILGKQMIYVPKHTLSGTFTYVRGSLSASGQYQFNSKKYVTFDHSGKPFPSYFIINAWMAYKHNFKNQSLSFQVQGNNLTNTLYANLKKNAMPMRTVSLNLIFVFNKFNK
jgi:vitamin B12 transporter